ncbi:polyribonucleotide nucleotidyltransferase [Candidatus Peregrinibacteria bacterium]|nr:MAG: polyribonucleotide nucleotidyltransferase [Candidatus Peregrinibacteria bacterium]
MSDQVFTLDIQGKTLSVSTGKLAQMANGSAVASIDGTHVLATATMSSSPREGIDFLPVMVNYQERYYAAGVMKSSRFNKREARPSDDKILMGRVVDRQIRPLFPKHIRHDIQVMLIPLSYDRENEHDILSGIAASAALAISDIPWNGPSANVRVGLINGEFVLNPTPEQRALSDLDLVVATSDTNVVMIEAGAKEISEEKMLEAIEFGRVWGMKIAAFIAEIAQKIGKTKQEIPAIEKDLELKKFLEAGFTEKMQACIFETPGKLQRFARKAEIQVEAKEAAIAHFGEERDLSQLGSLFSGIFSDIIRDAVLKEKRRINNRKVDEVRPLFTEVGILPRTHGSGLFQRGETQGLSLLTLASPGNELIVDGIEGEKKVRYLHHYNFPPFSVGECSNRLSTGNREIGHGALAEKALVPVLPDQKDFPYVMRVVTEILQSNGSSSMAATCGSTLALMDGGVPISAPVAGIAMGLMTDHETGAFQVLSDIQDEEDFGGDMDFKVAGTEKGITAIQMDIKIIGISQEIFATALKQAHKGRLQILEKMLESISTPRKDISPYAPRLLVFKINPIKIREVIGKGGEMINKIIDATGVEMNIEDDGTIIIASANEEKALEAKRMVDEITAEPEVGKTYDGKVVRVEDYGAFVEIMKGTQGLVHVSLISNERVDRVADHLKVGQLVRVKLTQIDEVGRLRLSMKDAENK